MEKPTVPDLTIDHLRARLADLEQERQAKVQLLQVEIARLNGSIGEIKLLLGEPLTPAELPILSLSKS